MPILKSSQLRDFIKATSYIRPDKTFPMTSYYYLDRNRIVKTNIVAFCEMVIGCDIDKPVLIDQQKLQSFLSASKDESFELSIKKELSFKDSKFTATQTIFDPANFPGVPLLPQLESVEIDQAFIDALSIAKNFVSVNENMPHLNYVHVNKNYIAATDGYILYHERFEGQKFPNILLSKDEISLLQQYSTATLYNADNRYFFKTGNFIYSFAKTENKTPDFDHVLTKISSGENSFTLDKQEIQSFCELANSYTGSSIPGCILTNEQLKFIDTSGEEIVWPVSLGNDFEFAFNSRYLLPALKALPVSELKCSMANSVHKAIVIKDENFICSLMGFIPQSN